MDANVLMERIKEELKTEKSIVHAFDTGYSKAKITVLDANITTLIAAPYCLLLDLDQSRFRNNFRHWDTYYTITAYFLARHLTSLIVLRKNNSEVKI